MTNNVGNSSKSDGLLITWSREVTRQIENLISPLPQSLWPSNMASRATHLWNHMILWQRGDVWSHDKLKPWQILFGKAYGNETWQVGELWWSERTHEVTRWQTKNKVFLPLEDVWPPNFAGSWRMVKQSLYWSHTTLITWSQKVKWQTEKFGTCWGGGDVVFASGRKMKIFSTVFWDFAKKFGQETVFSTLDGADNYWKK